PIGPKRSTTIANGTLMPRRHSDKRTSRHAGADHLLAELAALCQTWTLVAQRDALADANFVAILGFPEPPPRTNTQCAVQHGDTPQDGSY
ncbi:hypothetical protein, partial [Mycolicibacterium alvei]|uniref:hypothetical protein n=1 Tax=Mycolicibacterium alvei TaxID=67081 RepID=UPI0021F3529D